jgi:Fe-S cluster assembly ATP-binding protein
MLDVKNLTVSVGKKKIIRDFNFNFKKGKVYAIMGPNGSGKSTLAFSIMGHPNYKTNGRSKIILKNKNIIKKDAQKRSEAGLFMSFQTPLSLSGVTVNQLLQLALSGKKDALAIRQEVTKYARELKVSEELLGRSLNDGASGGEKKKMEILQAAVLDRDILIFDEIDTGVDVDALRTISKFINNHKKNKICILITHYNRILKHIKPDNVLVLVNGKLVEVGNYKLAQEVEKKGYAKHN